VRFPHAFLVCAALLVRAPAAVGQPTLAFTVSMPQPATHNFHVSFRCDGLQGETQDFKLPVWTPGYYRVLDYARNIANFRAENGQGAALAWEKVTRNTWRVVTAGANAVTLSYDVYGATAFAAQNYLGENRAFITPPGMFMHPAGRLQQAVTVRFQTPPNWTRIATGLDPAPGRPGAFSAADFDVLYDCPILMGTQELLRFEVRGVPHEVAIENVPAGVDRQKMLADLKKMVETATGLIGDIPYTHYTFLMMGQGNGGIEHLNSAAIAFNGASLATENGYRGWLSYVTHEYFHNFNVKRIRPIALGPFDYDAENLTNMLWVSEGLSVYYQDLVMVRSGLMTRQQYLDKMKTSMARFENAAGHHYQSATDSSATTWGTSGVGGDRNTTISYYDNGAMLGAMLDLKIRTESQNRKSLDDVMRALYRKYYQSRKRGFTDAEFRQECESAAGGPLTEVFEYASTNKDVDYAKYFALAGLAVDVTTEDAPGTSTGLNMQTRDGKLIVSEVAAGSPAAAAGLAAGDEIVEADGAGATPKALNDLLAAKKAGDRMKIRYSRGGAAQDVEVTLAKNLKRSYSIQVMAQRSALQGAIWEGWLHLPSP
jgi:predicted metalloprotease with PDZ domain